MHALPCCLLGSATSRGLNCTRLPSNRRVSERAPLLKPRATTEATPGDAAAAGAAPKPAARRKPPGAAAEDTKPAPASPAAQQAARKTPAPPATAGAGEATPRAPQAQEPRTAAKLKPKSSGTAAAKAQKGAADAKRKPPPRTRTPPRPVAPPPPLEADPPGHRCGYVAIVGKPNAGKSTLLNALVGQKLAIVTAKPQTTRHRILGIISAPGHQAVLVDTPGVLAAPRVALDAAMMRSVRTALTQADVLCAVIDASVAAQLEDPSDGLAGLSITGAEGGPPLLVLLNKCDLLPPDQAERVRMFFEQLPGVSAAMCASAMTGEGVKQLEDWITSALPFGPTLYPKDMARLHVCFAGVRANAAPLRQVSEHPERFFVAEIVRERIFELYRLEIPYCTTVTVLEHRERTKEGLNEQGEAVRDYIRVRITVERESQKPILLGKGGAAIKELGSSSRVAIEDFLQRKVFLEMKVEVANGWRDSEDALERFGINNPNMLV